MVNSLASRLEKLATLFPGSSNDLRAAAAAVRALDVAETSLKRVVRKADRQLSSECESDAIVLVKIITECKYASDTIAAAKKAGAE